MGKNKAILLCVGLAGLLIAPCHYLGVPWGDWTDYFFDVRDIPNYYPPWTALILCWLPWSVVCGLSLGAYITAVAKRAESLASGLMAFTTMPLLWTMSIGQIDGLTIVGLLGLPYLVPLVMVKPQIAMAGVLSSRRAFVVAATFLLLSFIVWGFWPLDTIRYADVVGPEDVSLGMYGLPLTFLVLYFVPGWGVDKLMLAWSFITPHLILYNLVPLMPVIARFNWKYGLLISGFLWVPYIVSRICPVGWYLIWPALVLIGIGLWARR